jgi:murein DD-endopeptidase MepM/ murein hydrolase activator NlpD
MKPSLDLKKLWRKYKTKMNFLPHNKNIKVFSALVLVVFAIFSIVISSSYAQESSSEGGDQSADIAQIKNQIADRSSRIKELEAEIAAYKAEAAEISKEKKTLQGAIRSLDISRNQITTDIVLTENKIGASELKIRELELEIELQREKIIQNKDALKESLQNLNEAEAQSLLENLLAHESLSEFWDELESLERFRTGVRTNLTEISELKDELESNRLAISSNIDNLEGLKGELASKRGAVDANRSEKNQLLRLTANEESKYQSMISEREAKKNAFLAELKAFEAQLNFNVDPSRIPPAGSGVLRWPLDSITITQYFGNTAFARSGAYNGNGHNGVDFGVPSGTPVKAALSGVVEGVGDTDTVCPNASYGKWMLLKHNNGLSTLYAHLSGISLNPGSQVTTGQVIGYSGNTGYSTGPHLHFTVYATQGVKIMSRPSAVCGGSYTMPIADLEAYLNPLNFL